MSERRLRWALHGVVVATLAATWFFGGRDARAEEFTVDDTLQAIWDASVNHGVSYRWLRSITWCESKFYPYARGRAGERGSVQLHPRGELLTFRNWGYTDPDNPYEALDFLARRLIQGGARAWSCA